jgi:hypothetical protein
VTALVSNAAPAAPNQPVTYTATITSQYTGPVTGSVTFMEGAKTLGTVAVSAQQTATLTLSYPNAGSKHLITAAYSGDYYSGGSISPVLAEYVEILPVPSTTKMSTSGSPSLVNTPVTFTATVRSTYGPIPDGETVTFYDGATQIGTGSTRSGIATFSTSALSVKTHAIDGAYAGDGSFKPSTGGVQQIVSAYTTTTTLTASPNPSAYGQGVVLTTVVKTTGSTAPTGKVTFKNGTTSLGTVSLDATGTAILTTTKLPVGTDSLTASYGGDSQHGKSTSSTVSQTVNLAQITMALTSSPNPSAAGKAVKFTATLSSNGGLPNGQTVTFSYNGSTLGTATIGAGKASYSTATLPVGSDQITATYSGSADYSSATASQVQTVN